MNSSLITITYRYIIDAQNTQPFGKAVFNASYQEFLIKSQAYNPEQKFTSFKQMVNKDGRANSLHYKCGFPIAGIIESLKNKMPCLQDNAGKSFPFDTYQFELFDSDINNAAVHKFAVHFITGILTMFGTLGEYMILATGDHITDPSNKPVDTFLLKTNDNLSISSYQNVYQSCVVPSFQ